MYQARLLSGLNLRDPSFMVKGLGLVGLNTVDTKILHDPRYLIPWE